PNDGAWKGAVIVAAVMSLFDALNVAQVSGILPFDVSGIMSVIYKIPLAKLGFAWVVPAAIGFIAGSLIYKITGRKSQPYAL
ncbi:MAG TPA: branched-chain amino acid transport system II carrier protein, partial [Candidatus Alectryocaccobium stercorigallinarum]|nr:branched-chain amino acid transport system II carrier protein [Candidatus Alectryocaccobium stercorigallinarum]